jgi:hypothetical protein
MVEGLRHFDALFEREVFVDGRRGLKHPRLYNDHYNEGVCEHRLPQFEKGYGKAYTL